MPARYRLKCKQCKQVFHSRVKVSTCSLECKALLQAAKEQPKQQAKMFHGECKYCGEHFTSPHRRKTCSQRCRELLQSQNVKTTQRKLGRDKWIGNATYEPTQEEIRYQCFLIRSGQLVIESRERKPRG